MTPERWAAAQQLFEAALACGGDARAAFVNREAADRELAELVHGLLAADAEERAGTPLVSVVSDAVAEATAHPRPPLERLGPYKLVKMLGEGGMGAVYLAERDDDEFLQQVAIKVVRGLLEPERVRQFRAERQILAWLEHPNIARLLDGGTTPEGLPYLVMEHVEGVPIDEHCDTAAPDRGRPAAALPRGVRRGEPRAPQPGRAPRHQAEQHHGHRRGRAETARLRHRAAGARRRARHQRGARRPDGC